MIKIAVKSEVDLLYFGADLNPWTQSFTESNLNLS